MARGDRSQASSPAPLVPDSPGSLTGQHMNPDVEDSPPVGRFVHLDVITAHSPWCSPSTPEQYVQALARQYRIGPNSDDQPRPALSIADYGLHAAVKTAVA